MNNNSRNKRATRPEGVAAEGAIRKKWRIYEPGNAEDLKTWGRRFKCEDISILTIDGEEVIGCSEWMRADREVFLHVVAIHNAWVDSANTEVRHGGPDDNE